jgi:hypothetical protein
MEEENINALQAIVLASFLIDIDLRINEPQSIRSKLKVRLQLACAFFTVRFIH